MKEDGDRPIRKILLNKHVTINIDDNFVLFGIIDDVNTQGILFRTAQKTSWINFSHINDIQLEE